VTARARRNLGGAANSARHATRTPSKPARPGQTGGCSRTALWGYSICFPLVIENGCPKAGLACGCRARSRPPGVPGKQNPKTQPPPPPPTTPPPPRHPALGPSGQGGGSESKRRLRRPWPGLAPAQQKGLERGGTIVEQRPRQAPVNASACPSRSPVIRRPAAAGRPHAITARFKKLVWKRRVPAMFSHRRFRIRFGGFVRPTSANGEKSCDNQSNASMLK